MRLPYLKNGKMIDYFSLFTDLQILLMTILRLRCGVEERENSCNKIGAIPRATAEITITIIKIYQHNTRTER